MRTHSLLSILFILSFAFTGCDSADSREEIEGHYNATRFTVVIDGQTVDVLDAGGTLTMELRSDGSASGRLFVPEHMTEEQNDIPFGGTYTVTGDKVRFTYEADTFIRDTEWRYEAGRLSTEVDGITVVLEKE